MGFRYKTSYHKNLHSNRQSPKYYFGNWVIQALNPSKMGIFFAEISNWANLISIKKRLEPISDTNSA